MKTVMQRYVAMVSLSIVFFTASDLWAGLTVDWNVQFDTNHYGGGANEMRVSSHEDQSDDTAVYFDASQIASAGTLAISDFMTDEGSDWYLCSYGDILSIDSIESDLFDTILQHEPYVSESVHIGIYGDFFLGFTTSEMGLERDVFGWVHMQNDNGELSMLQNAVVYGSEGIVIGTFQAVPEPITWVLMLCGGGVMFMRHRKHLTSSVSANEG